MADRWRKPLTQKELLHYLENDSDSDLPAEFEDDGWENDEEDYGPDDIAEFINGSSRSDEEELQILYGNNSDDEIENIVPIVHDSHKNTETDKTDRLIESFELFSGKHNLTPLNTLNG